MITEFYDIKEQTFTQIGKRSNIRGNLYFGGPTRVAAVIEGDITMGPSTLLVLERTAYCRGNITGHIIEIYGRVEGQITANEKIVFHPGGSFKGTLSTKNLVIHPGASVDFEGQSTSER